MRYFSFPHLCPLTTTLLPPRTPTQHALKALGYFVWQEQSQFERAHEDALLSRLLQCGRDAQKAGNKAVLVVCLWCLGVQQFSAAAVGDVFDDLLRFVGMCGLRL